MHREPFRKPAVAVRVAVAVVAAVVASACADAGGELGGPPVPDRPAQTFDGATGSLADLGEPLVVNFWASWCPPCVAQMPDFERVHQDVRDEVRFVGINTQDAARTRTASSSRPG